MLYATINIILYTILIVSLIIYNILIVYYISSIQYYMLQLA